MLFGKPLETLKSWCLRGFLMSGRKLVRFSLIEFFKQRTAETFNVRGSERNRPSLHVLRACSMRHPLILLFIPYQAISRLELIFYILRRSTEVCYSLPQYDIEHRPHVFYTIQLSFTRAQGKGLGKNYAI